MHEEQLPPTLRAYMLGVWNYIWKKASVSTLGRSTFHRDDQIISHKTPHFSNWRGIFQNHSSSNWKLTSLKLCWRKGGASCWGPWKDLTVHLVWSSHGHSDKCSDYSMPGCVLWSFCKCIVLFCCFSVTFLGKLSSWLFLTRSYTAYCFKINPCPWGLWALISQWKLSFEMSEWITRSYLENR